MFTPVLAPRKFVDELIFTIGTNTQKICLLCETVRAHIKP